MPKKLSTSDKKKEIVHFLDYAFENRIGEKLQELLSPWRLMWVNFFVGVLRGIGFVFGTTIVVGFLVFFVAQFIKGLGGLPYFGEQIQSFLESFLFKIINSIPKQ